MADLFNQQISATYSGLLKTSSSGVLSASLSQISDGRGNTSPLYLSTGSIQFYGAYSFPNADGSANQVLKTDGAGVLTWENDSLSNTLNFSGGTGTGSVTLDTQTLAFTGTANEIVTSASSQAITLSFPTAGVTLPDGSSATTQASTDSSTLVATTAYVKSVVSSEDLDTAGDSGTGSIDLDSQSLSVLGTVNEITTVAANQSITLSFPTAGVTLPDGSVATTQTASNNSTKVATTAYVEAAVAAGGGGDVTKTGTITANQIAVWNDSTDELRSDETVTIGTDHSITLLQKNSLDEDRGTYNIGGGNIDDVTGQNNVGFGKDNLGYLVSGQDNNAFGNNSQISNSSGSYNTSFGNQTLNYHSSSDYNVAIGYQSLRGDNIGGTPSSDNNTAIGTFSLRVVDGGNSNTAIGINSGSAITTGSNNVIIGSFTGFRAAVVGGLPEYSIITSNNNIVISDGVGNVRQSFDSNGAATFSGSVAISEIATITQTDAGTENRGLRLTNTTGSRNWNITAGRFDQNNDDFTIRCADTNVDALYLSATGAATFSGSVDAKKGTFTDSFTLGFAQVNAVSNSANNSSYAGLRLINTSSNGGYFTLGDVSTAQWYGAQAAFISIGGALGVGVKIRANADDTSGITIPISGNVGIKTNSALQALAVSGNAYLGNLGNTLNFSGGSNSKFLEIGASGDALLVTHASGYGVGYFGYTTDDRLVVACDNGGGNNKIDFIVNAGGTTGGGADNLTGVAPALRISGNGNVGIGQPNTAATNSNRLTVRGVDTGTSNYAATFQNSAASNENIVYFRNDKQCYFYGDLAVAGTKNFLIKHPLESKNKTHSLVHASIESPEVNNLYRGKVNLVNGTAEVNLDEVSTMTEGTFTALNNNIQCFTTNESDWDAVKGSVEGNILTIECQNNKSNANVSWMVIGERQDEGVKIAITTDSEGKLIVEPIQTPNP